jgi:GT2 family glycosyltransferase
MCLAAKIKNLSKVTKRLQRAKWKRAKTILRDYGLREFLRRVGEKMKYGDAPVHLYERIYVVTNESYLRKGASLSRFRPQRMVSFQTAPGAQNIGRLDILTSNPSHDEEASLTLEIYKKGSLLSRCTVNAVKDNAYTTFHFLPLLDVMYHPLDFLLTSSSKSGGILVNRHRAKHGFTVQGGGSVACRIYTRLDALYVHWLKNNVPKETELIRQRAHQFLFQPKISIIVPLYNTPERLLREMINSVLTQTYSNLELCLADGSTDRTNRAALIALHNDDRIRYQKLTENQGISGNSNCAIEMATGDYIGFLDHDDTLQPHALYKNVELLNKDADYEFIYSDEDKVTEDGSRRFDPFFKPDFSPNMLYAFNYITHFTVIKKNLIDQIGPFDDRYNGAQDYDLFLRAVERAKKIGHIKDVLYNWRIAETSTAFSSQTKQYTVAAGQAAIEASIKRRSLCATVTEGALPNYYNVAYALPDPLPKISIIIPNKDEKETLKKCLSSILTKSTYSNYEIIVVENNSEKQTTFSYYAQLENNPRIRLLTFDRPFNYAALNNFAARKATGDLLLFLNNDMSVISADWLEQMAMHACRPDVGAVGAKLYYPDDTLQHGGIVLRIGGVAGHSHKGSGRDEVGAFARLTLTHDLSAVTAACLMTRKEIFESIGGFDEQFVVAFNDVDLCLNIREKGLSVLWTPFAELYHYESKTRGYEETPEKIARFEREQKKWLNKWEARYPVDPFYNPNLTHLLQDYSIDPGKTGSTLAQVSHGGQRL